MSDKERQDLQTWVRDTIDPGSIWQWGELVLVIHGYDTVGLLADKRPYEIEIALFYILDNDNLLESLPHGRAKLPKWYEDFQKANNRDVWHISSATFYELVRGKKLSLRKR